MPATAPNAAKIGKADKEGARGIRKGRNIQVQIPNLKKYRCSEKMSYHLRLWLAPRESGCLGRGITAFAGLASSSSACGRLKTRLPSCLDICAMMDPSSALIMFGMESLR